MGKPKRVTTREGRAANSAKPGKRKPPKKLWRRILLWTTITLVSIGLIGTGAVAVAYATLKLPDPNSDFRTNTTFVYYQDGKQQLGSFQVQNRVTIPYETMPQTIKDAIVAAENRTFWTDPGISVTGLFRAALGLVGISSAENTATGGGSTITQQYIKIMYLSQERTFARKATEIMLSAKMGGQLSKQDILWGYLNTVYFGRGSYGIEAASQAYLKKPAAQLSLAESVALSAIVNSPGNLDPYSGEKQAADLLERYQYTLNGLVEMGKITEAQKVKVYAKLPKFVAPRSDSRLGGQKGFLLKLVENELLAKGFTAQQISGDGLKVTTTFNSDAQDAAVAAAEAKTLQAAGGSKKKAKNLNAAIASVDNQTGGVLAIYGGPDYVQNSRNWATTPRQTGSTFKPYALAAALREGWTLSDRVSRTAGRRGNLKLPTTGGKQITLQNATTQSVNDAYFNLVSHMSGGGEAVAQAAVDAGAPSGAGWKNNAYMPLGEPEVSPINQASAYSTFANSGIHRDWHVITEVQDADGKVIYTPDTAGSETIEPDVARDVTYALTKVTRDGTGRTAGYLPYPVAGKTGTKGQPARKGYGRETVAAWFVGYTAQITTAVMFVAGKDGNQPLETYSRSFYGSGYPAQTWLLYMQKAMDGKDRVNFEGPTRRESTQKPKAEAPDEGPATAPASPTQPTSGVPPTQPGPTATHSEPPKQSAPASSDPPDPPPSPTATETP